MFRDSMHNKRKFKRTKPHKHHTPWHTGLAVETCVHANRTTHRISVVNAGQATLVASSAVLLGLARR